MRLGNAFERMVLAPYAQRGAVCLMAPAPDNRVFLCLVLLNSPISLGKITPTTLILPGMPDSTRPLDGMSPRITWTLYASNGSVASYEHFQKYDKREKSP